MTRLGFFIFVAAVSPLLASCGGSNHGSSAPFIRVWGSSTAGETPGGPAVATFNNPVNMAVDSAGNTYVADYDGNSVRKIDPSGNVTNLTSQTGFQAPFGMTMTSGNVLYVETDADDTGAKDDTTGTIWTVNLTTGAATVVVRDIGRPRGLCALADGRIAIADLVNNDITVMDATTKVISPIAGVHGTAGFTNGTGTGAKFSRPYGLAQQSDGSLLVADQTNNCVRKVTLAGAVTTFAGTGTAGAKNGAVASATFNGPQDVAVAPDGTVYVADTLGFLVRRISGGQVFTEAGNGKQGFVDGTGTNAEFYGLEGMAISKDGSSLWVSDGNQGNGTPFNRVRHLQVP